MKLSSYEIWHFTHSGFLKVEGVVPLEMVQEAKRVLLEGYQNPTGPHKLSGAQTVSKLYAVHARGDVFANMIRLPNIIDILISLMGENIVFTPNRHNQGGMNYRGDATFRYHRDQLRPGHYTVIVYLEDSTPENGATYVIPGSHHLPHFPEREGGMWLDPVGHEYSPLCAQGVPVPVKAGGILAFDSYLLHTVGDNTTDNSRASVVFGYAPVNELTGVVPLYQQLVSGIDLYRGNVSLKK